MNANPLYSLKYFCTVCDDVRRGNMFQHFIILMSSDFCLANIVLGRLFVYPSLTTTVCENTLAGCVLSNHRKLVIFAKSLIVWVWLIITVLGLFKLRFYYYNAYVS